MARKRSSAGELARLFNQFSFPFYILDGDGAIRFCNGACLEWLGVDAADVLGKRPRYRAMSEPLEHPSVVDGLAPPPSAQAADRPQDARTAGAVWRRASDGAIAARRARFTVLSEDAADRSIVAVSVDREDFQPGKEDVAEEADISTANESECLHELLLSLRRRRAEERTPATLLGESAPMTLIRARVALATRTGAPVMIHGPLGSGRRHAAEAIHYSDHYSDADSTSKRLVPLDCDILDDDLILTAVSALATANRVDESGNRIGTLLLAEADRLAPATHAPLYEIFSDRHRRFPFRLIVTARTALTALPREAFLPELAALLGTMEIEVPPLASRREDIPLLAQYFLERANAESEVQREGFVPETFDALDGYSWPGNVGELARTVFEAHEAAEGPWIAPQHLPRRLYHAAQAAAYPEPKAESISLDETLEEIEGELLRRALRQADGNKAEAARLLGVTRSRLLRRLEMLGIG